MNTLDSNSASLCLNKTVSLLNVNVGWAVNYTKHANIFSNAIKIAAYNNSNYYYYNNNNNNNTVIIMITTPTIIISVEFSLHVYM